MQPKTKLKKLLEVRGLWKELMIFKFKIFHQFEIYIFKECQLIPKDIICYFV